MDPGLADALAVALHASVQRAVRLGGGDVAAAYRVTLDDGRVVFAKAHDAPPADGFATEAVGLRWLRAADAIPVPRVLAVGADPAFLVLEWIEEGSPSAGTEAAFGRALAALHRAGAPCFGRDDRRPTGSRSLPNDPAPSWSAFYADRRLRPLAVVAESVGALGVEAIAGLRRIADRLDDLVGPAEPPARLHGDLWAGNRVLGVGGVSWLVDPAALGGHRELDLAMMRLFGGFGRESYAAYAEVFPLASGWEDRIVLHQLAPLVGHAIRFGGSYVGAATDAIARYA